MTRIFKIRLLPILCLLVIGLVVACKKENKMGSDKIELLSFGPTGARHGDTLKFIGTNLNTVSKITFTGEGAVIAQSAFIQQTAEMIMAKVPASAEQGFVTLTTPTGDIVSKTKFNLEVMPTVTISTKDARPGQNITLTGQYLNWVTRVTFNNSKAVDTFVSRSLQQLVVKVPVDAQTGPLVISYSGTKPEQMQTADTLRVALPQITAFSPNPVTHAADLTITGTNLDLAKQIKFQGVTAAVTNFVSQSATQIVVKVPASTEKGKVTLVAASGVSTQSASDLDVVLPAVATMSPNPVDPGANLTVTGTNLNLVSSVTFNNAPAVTTFVSQAADRIVVKVPTGVSTGKITLGVKNSTLTVQSANILEITGDAPPPTLALPLYKDAVSNWNGWVGDGWGGTKDYNNANPVREGAKSIKVSYVGGYGSPVQLGGASVNMSSYSTFKLSVYGAPGSAGKRITLGINGVNGKSVITVVEGKWTDYSIPINTLTSETTLKEIWVQEYSGTGGFTVYVDAVGLN